MAKIAIVQSIAGNIGGEDKIVDGLIKILKEKNKLTLLTFTKTSKDYGIPTLSKIPIKIPFMGIYQKLIVPKHDYSSFDLVISIGMQIKTDKPCIIYDMNQMASLLKGKMPRKYDRGFWRIYAMPYQLIRKLSTSYADATYVSTSKYSAQELEMILGKKVDVLYPPVNLDGVHSKEKLNQVCVIGRISPEKNLEQTVEILNNIDHHCIIAGNVTKPNKMYFKKLKAMAKPHITFVDNISRINLLSLLAESKIIFTSSKETFGISTVEGIASGCIPIVPDNSAHPETVPFTSLRYLSDQDAVTMLNVMMNVDASLLVTKLQEHIKQFTTDSFKINMNKLLVNHVKV